MRRHDQPDTPGELAAARLVFHMHNKMATAERDITKFARRPQDLPPSLDRFLHTYAHALASADYELLWGACTGVQRSDPALSSLDTLVIRRAR